MLTNVKLQACWWLHDQLLFNLLVRSHRIWGIRKGLTSAAPDWVRTEAQLFLGESRATLARFMV